MQCKRCCGTNMMPDAEWTQSSSLQLVAACAYPATQLQSKVPGVGYPSRCPEHAHAQGVSQFSQHCLTSL